jgi:hypothetical protein
LSRSISASGMRAIAFSILRSKARQDSFDVFSWYRI